MKLIIGIVFCVMWAASFIDLMEAIMPDNARIHHPDIIDNDIIVTPKEREMLRQGLDFTLFPFQRWFYQNVKYRNRQVRAAIVPYILTGYKANEYPVIQDAIAHWNTRLKFCVRWVDASENTSDYSNIVEFKKIEGCSSRIGRQESKGKQSLSLTPVCLFGGDPRITILHEMEHAIGMGHEQIRYDRNEYIKVNEENLGFYKSDFKIPGVGEYNDLGEYDFYSIMHYSRYLSDDKNKTMPLFNVKDPGIDESRIGKGTDAKSFSAMDLAKIKLLYDCEKL